MSQKEAAQAADVLDKLQPVLEALNRAPCSGGGCTFKEENRKPFSARKPETYCDPCAALHYANRVSAFVSGWRRGALMQREEKGEDNGEAKK